MFHSWKLSPSFSIPACYSPFRYQSSYHMLTAMSVDLGSKALLSRARFCFVLSFGASLLGCSSILTKSEEPDLPPITKPLSEEQRNAVLDEMGRNFVYGDGLGNAAINVGAAILFPPYIIALVGNGALSIAGYEPLSISQVMPEKVREPYVTGRDAITGAPGQAVAAMAGEEFRTQSMAKSAIKSAMLTPNEEVIVR